MTDSGIFSVQGKVVLVVGASRGIGKAIAKLFSDQGAIVAGASRRIDPEHGLSYFYETDVRDRIAVQDMVDELVSELGKIDVLVNAFGVASVTAQDEYFLSMLEVNLAGVFSVCSSVIPSMLRCSSGSIINIASVAASRSIPNNPAYMASKGGVVSLTKALARDYGDKGLRVNCISPGYILTDMTNDSYKKIDTQRARANLSFLGRWGMPSEIAPLAVFLGSDASSFITGNEIFVDGGWHAKGL